LGGGSDAAGISAFAPLPMLCAAAAIVAMGVLYQPPAHGAALSRGRRFIYF
jgi:hypothetical protein